MKPVDNKSEDPQLKKQAEINLARELELLKKEFKKQRLENEESERKRKKDAEKDANTMKMLRNALDDAEKTMTKLSEQMKQEQDSGRNSNNMTKTDGGNNLCNSI